LVPIDRIAAFTFPDPTNGTAEFDLAPGHPHTIRQDLSELVDDAWHAFKGQQLALFVWGRVDFFDAFNEPRWARFRLFQTGGYVLNLGNYDEGNETSESPQQPPSFSAHSPLPRQ
jgi:hypothetical protein